VGYEKVNLLELWWPHGDIVPLEGFLGGELDSMGEKPSHDMGRMKKC
jgi:hypothetical protein